MQRVKLAFALSSVGVQFVADAALALEAAERVDALVMTAVRVRRTLVELCHHTAAAAATAALQNSPQRRRTSGNPDKLRSL